MASICKQSSGRRMIQFVDGDKRRRCVRLGKVSQRMAEGVRLRVEHLATARASGQPLDSATADWLADIDDVLHDRLARAGLVEPRQQQERATLAGFLDSYIESRIDIKPASRVIFRHVRRNLVERLGADRPLREITITDADEVRLQMIRDGLAASTICKRLQRARQVFKAAKRQKLIDENPFGDVKHHEGNPAERQQFVTREETSRVLAACNPTWRLIVTLARYGGLRCPSEVLSLQWQGVDWAAGRITVDSPKTAHHPGRGSRVVPMFPELRGELEAAWDRASEGAVYVVDADHYRAAAQGPDGWRNANLRTQFERILKQAGVTPWPRLFQNLRLSRETELAAEHPIHVVTAWMGNTPKVAMRHYLQVTDSDFEWASEGAAKCAAEAQQNAQQSPQAAIGRNTKETTQALAKQGLGPIGADCDSLGQPPKVAGTGFEPATSRL